MLDSVWAGDCRKAATPLGSSELHAYGDLSDALVLLLVDGTGRKKPHRPSEAWV